MTPPNVNWTVVENSNTWEVIENKDAGIIEVTGFTIVPTATGGISFYSGQTLIGTAKKLRLSEDIVAVMNGDTVELSIYTPKQIKIELTEQNILEHKITLPRPPIYPNLVRLIPDGGIEQIKDQDFSVQGSEILFTGLQGFFQPGDMVVVYY